jgi:hypothetical protein
MNNDNDRNRSVNFNFNAHVRGDVAPRPHERANRGARWRAAVDQANNNAGVPQEPAVAVNQNDRANIVQNFAFRQWRERRAAAEQAAAAAQAAGPAIVNNNAAGNIDRARPVANVAQPLPVVHKSPIVQLFRHPSPNLNPRLPDTSLICYLPGSTSLHTCGQYFAGLKDDAQQSAHVQLHATHLHVSLFANAI